MTKNNTFTKIELIILVVLVSFMIVGGLILSTLLTNDKNLTNFKEDSNIIVTSAKNAYLSITKETEDKYLTTSTDGLGRGMCITITGLINNGFLLEEYKDYNGYIVIEEIDSKSTYSLYLTNNKYVIPGYSTSKLSLLELNDGITEYVDEDFESLVKEKYSSAKEENGGTGKTYESSCITEKIS